MRLLNQAALFAIAAGLALGQTPPPNPSTNPGAANASVSGVVKDAGTGQPLKNYVVSTSIGVTWVGNTVVQSRGTTDVKATTDSQGRYTLSDLPPGEYRLRARAADLPGSGQVKHLTLAGRDLSNIDFNMVVTGKISGKVIDENKEPVPGMTVYLVSKEYYLGSAGYFLSTIARTDDRGEYTLNQVEAGHSYLIVTDKRVQNIPAYSDAPLNPKMRRAVPMRTWYPNSPSRDGALPIVIRAGETRERADIEVKKSPNYCMEGAIEGPNGPEGLALSIEALSPSSGTSSHGGNFMSAPSFPSARDGKFRICDLYPGSYRLTASERGNRMNSQQPPVFGVSTVTVSDKDLAGVKVSAGTGLPLDGEVVLDGAAPQTPIDTKVSVALVPLLRTQLSGEKTQVRADIPGTFSFPGMLIDVYGLRPFFNSPSLYVKDITYSGASVLYEPLRFGFVPGNAGLRVVIGQDGAKFTARVTDKDGNPAPDMKVVGFPADISSEGMLQARMVSGQTNQQGQYTSTTLAPGKYLVFASPDSYDATVDSISKLWRSRSRFTEVELPPSGSAQVMLAPVILQ